jgi:hypothetical protein
MVQCLAPPVCVCGRSNMAHKLGDNALAVAADRRREEGCEDERLNSHKLDKDVKRRAGGVLERVANGVAGHCCLVAVRSLGAKLAGMVRAAWQMLV